MPKIAKIYGFYIQLKTSLNSRIFKDVFQFMPKFQDFPGFSRTASKFQGFSGFSRTLATLNDQCTEKAQNKSDSDNRSFCLKNHYIINFTLFFEVSIFQKMYILYFVVVYINKNKILTFLFQHRINIVYSTFVHSSAFNYALNINFLIYRLFNYIFYNDCDGNYNRLL